MRPRIPPARCKGSDFISAGNDDAKNLAGKAKKRKRIAFRDISALSVKYKIRSPLKTFPLKFPARQPRAKLRREYAPPYLFLPLSFPASHRPPFAPALFVLVQFYNGENSGNFVSRIDKAILIGPIDRRHSEERSAAFEIHRRTRPSSNSSSIKRASAKNRLSPYNNNNNKPACTSELSRAESSERRLSL